MTEGESTAAAVQELEPTPVAKPDQAAYDAQLAELNSEIEELTKRRERFGDKIEKAKSGSQEINARVKEARDKFNAVKDEQAKAKALRQSLISQRDSSREMTDKMANDAKAMKKNIRYSTLEAIDDRLKSLEIKHATETQSLKEEREMIKEIEALRGQRKQLSTANDLMAKADADRDAAKLKGKDLNEKITSAGDALKEVNDRLNAAYEALKALDEERAAAGLSKTTVTDLIKERDELRTTINGKYDALKKLKNDFYQANRAYTDYTYALRRYKQAQFAKQRAEQAAAREAAAADSSAVAAVSGAGFTGADDDEIPHFYAREMATCDTILGYLNRIAPKVEAGPSAADTAAAKAAADAAVKAALVGLGGQKLKVAGDADADAFGAFLGSKSKKDASKKEKKEEKKKEDSLARSINHAPSDIQSFASIGLAPPSTYADIADSIAAVKVKKAYYETAPPPEQAAKDASASSSAASSGARAGAHNGVASGPGGRGGFRGGRGGSRAGSSRAAVASGAAVTTPYGSGTVSETRDNGSVVVALANKTSGFYATAYLAADQVTAQ